MEMNDEKIQEMIKDVALQVQQSTKHEHSGLIADIRVQIAAIKEHQRNIDAKTDLILEQTTEHNHRMSKMEMWKATSEGWIKGFGVTVACIITLIGVIYYTMTKSEEKTQGLIEQHIQQTK
jgi:hypothetical protein